MQIPLTKGVINEAITDLLDRVGRKKKKKLLKHIVHLA